MEARVEMGDVWGFVRYPVARVYLCTLVRVRVRFHFGQSREEIGSPVYYILYAEFRFRKFEFGRRSELIFVLKCVIIIRLFWKMLFYYYYVTFIGSIAINE